MAKATCTVEGCERKHWARGMCKPHYRRDWYVRNRQHVLDYAKVYGEANREAITAREKAYFAANPGVRAATVRKYKAANPDKVKTDAENFRRRHPERQAAWSAAWHEANWDHAQALMKANYDAMMQDPERVARERDRGREKSGRRRAMMRKTETERVDLAAILERDGMWCYLCEKPIASLDVLHFDHVIPLSKGGPHAAANIRPSHALCNLRKGARLIA